MSKCVGVWAPFVNVQIKGKAIKMNAKVEKKAEPEAGQLLDRRNTFR